MPSACNFHDDAPDTIAGDRAAHRSVIELIIYDRAVIDADAG
jgi:hypothetical protein